MKRRHLIELHEQPWFPEGLRSTFQQTLSRVQTLFDIYRHAAAPFAAFLTRLGPTEVLDLCSGGTGPLLQLRSHLRDHMDAGSRPRFVLSDLYPDLARFEALKAEYPAALDFVDHPVNAMEVPDGLPRVRTMFAALHHFKPDQVVDILGDAARRGDGIAIFEATRRTPLHLTTMAVSMAPLALALHSWALRPWRPRHVLWGTFVPLVPLAFAFDATVSVLRSYTASELLAFTEQVDAPDFTWEVGSARMPYNGLSVQYLFGWRRSAEVTATP
ncbi:MAG: hypothetical protein QF464_05075 [Myxococcota bacterium]|jgi:hypothetical protein|nr:hypothetical protein [Myxococcota bacterium]